MSGNGVILRLFKLTYSIQAKPGTKRKFRNDVHTFVAAQFESGARIAAEAYLERKRAALEPQGDIVVMFGLEDTWGQMTVPNFQTLEFLAEKGARKTDSSLVNIPAGELGEDYMRTYEGIIFGK